MHICLKMMKSLPRTCVCVCAHHRPIWLPGCTHARVSLLQFTSITSYNPISHSIDPQNCCSPEPAATLAFLPSFHHHCSLLHKDPLTHPTLLLSEQTQARSNMNYKCMANKREKGERKEVREKVERDRDGEKWLVETSEKMTPLQESIDQFLSKGDVRHEITWQFEH